MSIPVKTFSFKDFSFFKRLRDIPTHRLCELAVCRELIDQGHPVAYDASEHAQLWQQVKEACIQYKGKREPSSPDIDFICNFITQFSPDENTFPLNHPNHISRYVQQALILDRHLKPGANVIEIGANQGICSLTLNILGHSALGTNKCIDIIDFREQISYRAGAWLLNNFLRLPSTVHFTVGVDNLNMLCCFENGIDAIICRSVVDLYSRIMFVQSPPKTLPGKLCKKIINKVNKRITSTSYINTRELHTLFKNYKYLLGFLNKGGLISNMESWHFIDFQRKNTKEQRTKLFEKLKQQLEPYCSEFIYEIKENTYEDKGWKISDSSILCIK